MNFVELIVDDEGACAGQDRPLGNGLHVGNQRVRSRRVRQSTFGRQRVRQSAASGVHVCSMELVSVCIFARFRHMRIASTQRTTDNVNDARRGIREVIGC